MNPRDLSPVDGPGAAGHAPAAAAREPSWHLNTKRGGAGASLLPTSPTGQGMGMVKRRIRRVSTTRPGSPWIPDHFHGEGLPRKGTKEDFCCLNCYLPAKPSVCPKVLIINNRKNILVSKQVFYNYVY